MRKILGALAVSIALACGGPVAPGTLSDTIARNESQRLYDTCIQQPTRVSTLDLRRHCKKLYVLYHMNRQWEKCVNEGVRECGHRPRYTDVE